MIDFDLDRLFEDDDYPAVEVTRSLNAVNEYLRLLDEYLPHIKNQTIVRFAAEFEKKRHYAHPEDLEIDLEGIKQLTGETVPLFFYGSFVIALYAAFESTPNDFAGYIRKKESAPLQLADLREPNTRRKLELIIETVMRRPR